MEKIKQENQPLEKITNDEIEKCKRPLKLLVCGLSLFAANYALQESNIAPYIVEQAANVITAAGEAGLVLRALYDLHVRSYMNRNPVAER